MAGALTDTITSYHIVSYRIAAFRPSARDNPSLFLEERGAGEQGGRGEGGYKSNNSRRYLFASKAPEREKKEFNKKDDQIHKLRQYKNTDYDAFILPPLHPPIHPSITADLAQVRYLPCTSEWHRDLSFCKNVSVCRSSVSSVRSPSPVRASHGMWHGNILFSPSWTTDRPR